MSVRKIQFSIDVTGQISFSLMVPFSDADSGCSLTLKNAAFRPTRINSPRYPLNIARPVQVGLVTVQDGRFPELGVLGLQLLKSLRSACGNTTLVAASTYK